MPVTLVLAVLVATVVTWRLGVPPVARPSSRHRPAAVSPPPGLDLPQAREAPAVAAPLRSHDADPDQVAAAVRRFVSDPRLGRHVRVLVQQLDDGRELYEHGQGRVTPASTTKLLTTTAALSTLGAEHRFHTTVRASHRGRRLTLVGGGDPYLASRPVDDSTYPDRANLVTLARRTAEALPAGRAGVRLTYDSSLFAGPQVDPDWPSTYIPEGVVSPITALWVDEGRSASGGRVSDPPRVAARAFAQALHGQGVTVRGRPRSGTALASSHQVASVAGAPLGQVVQHVLDVSDNEAAEVLAHHVGLATNGHGSFAGGVAGVTSVLARLGIRLGDGVLHDGSGLSRRDRLQPATLVQVLRTDASAAHPGLRDVVTGLPVAGFTGSLTYRFDTGSAYGPGMVRAKTGTLTGVHGLAGLATDRDGDQLVFVAVADRVKVRDTLAARALLDRLAAALAGCRCGSDA